MRLVSNFLSSPTCWYGLLQEMRFVIFDTANKVSLITKLFIFENTLFMIVKKNSYCLCDSDTTATPPLKRNSKHKNQA